MKRSWLILAVVAVFALLATLISGCANLGGKSTSGATPAQIAAAICPVVQQDLSAYHSLFAIDVTNPHAAKISADLAKAEPIIAELCVVGAKIDASTIQAFIQTALPALADLVNYLPLTQAQKAKVTTDLSIAELAVGVVGVVAAQIQAANAPAVSSSAAK